MKFHFDCKIIPHSQHRYITCGDYWLKKGKMFIVASKMSNPGYSLAIIIHEMVEFVLCRMHKVDEDDITKFDIEFETGRCTGEPGDDPGAPYRQEHQAATHVERAVIAAFNLQWDQYEQEIDSLFS